MTFLNTSNYTSKEVKHENDTITVPLPQSTKNIVKNLENRLQSIILLQTKQFVTPNKNKHEME